MLNTPTPKATATQAAKTLASIAQQAVINAAQAAWVAHWATPTGAQAWAAMPPAVQLALTVQAVTTAKTIAGATAKAVKNAITAARH